MIARKLASTLFAIASLGLGCATDAGTGDDDPLRRGNRTALIDEDRPSAVDGVYILSLLDLNEHGDLEDVLDYTDSVADAPAAHGGHWIALPLRSRSMSSAIRARPAPRRSPTPTCCCSPSFRRSKTIKPSSPIRMKSTPRPTSTTP